MRLVTPSQPSPTKGGRGYSEVSWFIEWAFFLYVWTRQRELKSPESLTLRFSSGRGPSDYGADEAQYCSMRYQSCPYQ